MSLPKAIILFNNLLSWTLHEYKLSIFDLSTVVLSRIYVKQVKFPRHLINFYKCMTTYLKYKTSLKTSLQKIKSLRI